MKSAAVALALLSVLLVFAFVPMSCKGTKGKQSGGIGAFFQAEGEVTAGIDVSDLLKALGALADRIEELEKRALEKKDGTSEDPGTE